jgi:[ribosomal protein S5]-alanine N-acetyltransferase
MFMAIESERLKLVAASAELVGKFLGNKTSFEKILNASCPDSWPVEKDVYPDLELVLKFDTSLSGWLTWIVIHKLDKTIIGDAGYKGKPDNDGMVEIGYSIIPEYRNRGLATEAVQLVIDYAFQFPEIKTITAQTENNNIYSNNILRKFGMYCFDSVINEDKEILKWKLTKEEYTKMKSEL